MIMLKSNKNQGLKWFTGLAALVILSGCSSTKHYHNNLNKNITASLSKNSDRDVDARADIFSLDKQCNTAYQGSVWLGKKKARIGVQKNKQVLLSFRYLRSDWTGKHMIADDAVINARSGYRYEAKLSYIDKAYETFLYEINRRTGKRKSIEMVGIDACIEG